MPQSETRRVNSDRRLLTVWKYLSLNPCILFPFYAGTPELIVGHVSKREPSLYAKGSTARLDQYR
jgi:hypothetical protein